MPNSFGAVILIGVADQSSERLADPNRPFEEQATNIAHSYIQPPIQVITKEHTIEGMKIVEFTVEIGHDRLSPYQNISSAQQQMRTKRIRKEKKISKTQRSKKQNRMKEAKRSA